MFTQSYGWHASPSSAVGRPVHNDRVIPNDTILARPRLGIFGTGRMGRVHLEHLVRLHRAGRIDFVAMGDPLPSTLDAALAYVSTDRKSTRLNSSHSDRSRMPSSA